MNDTQPKSSIEILSDIGSTIAAERERQGITLESVSQRLRILEDHLNFIEAGKLDNLPAMTYVIGYIRSYARLLGLDDVSLCAELKASLTVEEVKPEYKFIENDFNKKTGAGRVALAALVAGIFIYGGWYSLSVVSTPTTTDIAAVEVQAPVEEASLKLVENVESIEPELVVVAPRIAPEAEPSDEDVSIVEDELSASDEQTAEITAIAPNTTTEANAPLSSTASPVVSEEASDDTVNVTNAYAVNRTPDAEIVIEAIANSWVEVTRADGTSVTSRLMRLGDTYLIPSDEDLYLTTGNAGGLNIRMGLDSPFTLGSWGEALRELPLNKAVISERY